MTRQKTRSPIWSMQLFMGIGAVILLLVVFFSTGKQENAANSPIPAQEQCRDAAHITAPAPQERITQWPPSPTTLTWSEPVRGIAGCRFFWDMGLNTYRTAAIAVRVNGDEVQFQGRLPDGTMTRVDFEHLNAETIEFAAVEKPVTIDVYWAHDQ